MNKRAEILIVGAGPTGLVLALELAYRNIAFRIIDKNEGPGESSRAMLVVPKVLESYRKFKLDQAVISKGIRPEYINYYVNSEKKADIPLGIMGKGMSAYPYVVTFPQDEHEKVLLEKLEEKCHTVEWQTTFDSSEESDGKNKVSLRKNDESTDAFFAYVIGCDGASSTVRKSADIHFTGDTYEEIFYVLDAVVEGRVIHEESGSFSFTEDYFALFFPLRNKETTRIIGMFPPDLVEKEEFSFDTLKPRLEDAFNISIESKNWFSDYKIHRRTAEQFRKGNIFLAGDAAHIHSPAGGQGMNLGIGDAVNLGWKLAAVLKQGIDDTLLDTYETERKELAESIVKRTDNAFKMVASQSKMSELVRTRLVPLSAKAAGRSEWIQSQMFKVLSQLYVAYDTSPLNGDSKAEIKTGSRLPFAEGELFEFTREAGWQLHVFNAIPGRFNTDFRSVEIVKRRWTDKARAAGFEKDKVYLVRPDGYIGWTGKLESIDNLFEYMKKWVN
ncbi:MAG: FAD-dependent monooxygenase [Alkalibacterium sp.]|nr:FAD-dependent monooxygenase [Alkalibacterium sp.]